YPNTQLLIAGKWCEGSEGRQLPVYNPATGSAIGAVALADLADLDKALVAADQGFKVWRNTSPLVRAQIMRRAADLLRERAEQIARLITLEQGKPIAQSRVEVAVAADTIDWFADEGRRVYGQIIPPRMAGVLQMTMKLPIGCVAAFTPWNFPITQSVRKIALGLAAGCSMIVKAPEETPASPAALVAAFVDAGVPEGVLNLVYGDPAKISDYLIKSPVIRKVSFTGSVGVGKTLASLAGQHMKRCTMELGGHAPVIVTADANLERAAQTMVAHKFRNSGQVCVSPTRFLIEDAAFDQFTNQFVELSKDLRVGPGIDEETQLGPLSNARRLDAISDLIADAVHHGATLRCGGRPLHNEGWFYAPTVLTDVPLSARIMNEEPFGPVAILNRFATLDDAIAEANRLPFGLAAYGWTDSDQTAYRLGAEVETGMMTINHLGLALPETPFGGTKDSGYGSEGGSEAIEAYLDTRFVTRTFA
uniref:NAD-dependent succinate-semialdehyde dehydrogenase n=1 Tax=uncultured Paracoccus sp. TaxID=189685 RepID=UPI00260E9203